MQIAFLGPVPRGTATPSTSSNVDGTGLHRLDVGRPAHSSRSGQPADPEIVFRGDQPTVLDPAHAASSPIRPRRHRACATCRHDRRAIRTTSRISTVSRDGNLVAYQSTDDGSSRSTSWICGRAWTGPLPAPRRWPRPDRLLARCEFVAYTARDGTARPARRGPGRWAGTGRGLGPDRRQAGDERSTATSSRRTARPCSRATRPTRRLDLAADRRLATHVVLATRRARARGIPAAGALTLGSRRPATDRRSRAGTAGPR